MFDLRAFREEHFPFRPNLPLDFKFRNTTAQVKYLKESTYDRFPRFNPDIHEKFTNHFIKQAENFTQDELSHIVDHTRTSQYDLQNGNKGHAYSLNLRLHNPIKHDIQFAEDKKKLPVFNFPELTEFKSQQNRHMKVLDSVLSKSTIPHDIHVYVGVPYSHVENLHKSPPYINPGYISGTIHKDVAKKFSSEYRVEDDKGYSHILNLYVKNTYPAMYVAPISNTPEEHEVLLRRNAHMKYLQSTIHDNDKTIEHHISVNYDY